MHKIKSTKKKMLKRKEVQRGQKTKNKKAFLKPSTKRLLGFIMLIYIFALKELFEAFEA